MRELSIEQIIAGVHPVAITWEGGIAPAHFNGWIGCCNQKPADLRWPQMALAG
jgi:hypothetical protein